MPHRKCGKLVVATNAPEMQRLEGILAQAKINGVEGVDIIEGAAAKRLEPHLACVAAMRSPETGVVDSHRYMLALQGDLEDQGGVVALNTPIESLRRATGGWEVNFGGADPQSITVDAVVNSAGLGAQKLGRATEGYPAERVPPLFLGKGSYFAFAGRPVFSRLIYPVPIRQAWRAYDARHGQAHTFRSMSQVGRRGELRRRCDARNRILCAHPRLLAGSAG